VVALLVDGLAASQLFTVADNNSNTFTRLKTININSTAQLDVWTATVGTGRSGHTVTAGNLTNTTAALIVEEWAGYSGAVDASATASDATSLSATVSVSPTGTPVNANEAVFFATAASTASAAFTTASGYSNLNQLNSNPSTLGLQSKTISAVATQSASNTFSPASDWLGIIVTLQQSVATQSAVVGTFRPGQTWVRRFAKAERHPYSIITTSTTNNYTQGLTASASFSGAIPRATSKSQIASLSFVGAAQRLTARSLSASTSFVGAMTKRSARALTASLNITATISLGTLKWLSANLSSSGVLARVVSRSMAASLSFIGSLPKRTQHSFAANLSFIGSFLAGALHLLALASSLNLSAASTRRTNKGVAGNLSFAAVVAKATGKGIGAGLSFTGAAARVITHTLTSGLSFLGTAAKQTRRSIAGSLSLVGTLASVLNHFGGTVYTLALNATLSLSGSIGKGTVKAFTASLGWLGNLVRAWIPGHPYTPVDTPPAGSYTSSSQGAPGAFGAVNEQSTGVYTPQANPSPSTHPPKPPDPPGSFTPTS
jgi:hypothetical protein